MCVMLLFVLSVLVQLGRFLFRSDFDSGNLLSVALVVLPCLTEVSACLRQELVVVALKAVVSVGMVVVHAVFGCRWCW